MQHKKKELSESNQKEREKFHTKQNKYWEEPIDANLWDMWEEVYNYFKVFLKKKIMTKNNNKELLEDLSRDCSISFLEKIKRRKEKNLTKINNLSAFSYYTYLEECCNKQRMFEDDVKLRSDYNPEEDE